MKRSAEAVVIDRRHGYFLALASMLLTLGLGCRSGPEPRVEEPQQPQQRATSAMPMPSPEELGDSPCGNPRWATLPPGVGDGEDSSNGGPSPDDDAPEGEEPNEPND